MGPEWGWIVAAIVGGYAALRSAGLLPGRGSSTPAPTAGATRQTTGSVPVTLPPSPAPAPAPTPAPVTVQAAPASVPAPAAIQNFYGILPNNGHLGPIQSGPWLYSPDQSKQLLIDAGGNIILYNRLPGGMVPLWALGSSVGQGQVQFLANQDGNLVLYDTGGNVRWASNTGGHPGAVVVLDNAGNLAVMGQAVILQLYGTTPSGGGGDQPSGNLPPAPGRDALCRISAVGMNGVNVSTSQGSWPSWGPDVLLGQLTAQDRQAIYQAHKAVGATHLVVAFFGPPYTGADAYGATGGVAFQNDFRGQEGTFVARLIEMIQAGLWPVIASGADGGYAPAMAALPALMAAMRGSPLGSIVPYVVVLTGFDSIDGIGDSAHDNGVTESNFVSSMRATIGQDVVLAHEIAYLGSVASILTPASGCWKDIDVFLCETAGTMLGNDPGPKIVAGTWDAEHNDFAPVYDKPAGQETPWTIFWQWWKRMNAGYHGAPDQPFNVVVPVTGKPGVTTAPVSSDSQGGSGAYLAAGTPRGRQYTSYFEFGTYGVTHANFPAGGSVVQNCRGYGAACGFDAVC